jgi:hypothetical protein
MCLSSLCLPSARSVEEVTGLRPSEIVPAPPGILHMAGLPPQVRPPAYMIRSIGWPFLLRAFDTQSVLHPLTGPFSLKLAACLVQLSSSSADGASTESSNQPPAAPKARPEWPPSFEEGDTHNTQTELQVAVQHTVSDSDAYGCGTRSNQYSCASRYARQPLLAPFFSVTMPHFSNPDPSTLLCSGCLVRLGRLQWLLLRGLVASKY